MPQHAELALITGLDAGSSAVSPAGEGVSAAGDWTGWYPETPAQEELGK